MMNEQDKSKVSKILIGFLLVLSVGLAIWAGYSFFQAHRYKTQLENTYLRAIEDTSTNLSNISSDLVKGLYAGTPTQMSLISSKLWKESSTAKASLSALPVADLNLENTYRFLSQVGDYAMYLSKKSVSEQRITPEERQQFVTLREYADRLSDQTQAIEQQLSSGELAIAQLAMHQADRMDGIDTRGDRTLPTESSSGHDVTENQQGEGERSQSPRTPSETKDPPAQAASAPVKAFGEGDGEDNPSPETESNDFEAMEKGFTGYPSLIYDGPFSDHILDKKPIMTDGQKEITRDEAKTKAISAAKVSAELLSEFREEHSTIPSYVFYNDGLSVSVAKNGGFLSYMIKPKPEGAITPILSKDDTIAKATSYLESLGVSSMKDTYYEINNGIMTINFAHYQADLQVICYTDLIKVSVNMATGEIMGFDCRGYLVNHKSRTFSQPKLSKEEAQKSLSENLTVENVRLALIPSQGQNEVFAYEFLSTGSSGDKVLVYVNADTGVEEQILILIETKDGVLTK